MGLVTVVMLLAARARRCSTRSAGASIRGVEEPLPMAETIAVKGVGPQGTRWLVAVLIPIVFAVSAWGYASIARSDRPAVALGLLSVAGLLAVSFWLGRHLRRWRSPLRRLEQTLAGVRAGDIPIEELSRFNGPLAPLARQIQEMAHELKLHRAEMQAVQAEIRQLVAQRTDALEQKLGSLRQQANRDPLTGLYNRRAFDEHVSAVVRQAGSTGGNVGLLMLDLDNFKLLNDTFGHAVGDEFLRDVGQIIRSGIRKEDSGFRYGGDEFVVVMPDAQREEADATAQRLVGLIDSLGRTLKLPQPVGASVGLANLRELADRTPAELLRQADRRQYEVKESRRLAMPGQREPSRPRA